MTEAPGVAAVVIGRNEGTRLVACLRSLQGQCDPIVYVDSGSTDDSVAEAERAGARLVNLDMTRPFTAARARNAGLASLKDVEADLVQFVDGDCILEDGWIGTARVFMHDHPDVAMLAGRLIERFPERSIYNRLCAIEWQTTPGECTETGGIVLARREPVVAAGAFDPSLIAGEEPDLCLRLRRAGWRIWRLDTPMAQHDADMTRFSQFWTRSRRAGWAALEGAMRHRAGPEGYKRGAVLSTLFWGLFVPGATALALLAALVLTILGSATAATAVAVVFMGLLGGTFLQVLRMAGQRRAKGDGWGLALAYAVFTLISKPAQLLGMAAFWQAQRRGETGRLIEYRQGS